VRGKCGSVVVFLGDLPTQLTVRELKDLVRAEIRSGPAVGPQVGRSICGCSIIRITDLDTGTVEHHGLVEIRPPLLAIQVIDRLDGRMLGGHRISARRYRQRSPMGSPRQGAGAMSCQFGIAPDLVERRRTNIRVELVETERNLVARLSSSLQWPWWCWPSKQRSPDRTAR
jgi:hypothetical protein